MMLITMRYCLSVCLFVAFKEENLLWINSYICIGENLECVKEDCEENKVLSPNPISLFIEMFSSLLTLVDAMMQGIL